jgi:hypothetical protein
MLDKFEQTVIIIFEFILLNYFLSILSYTLLN